MHHWLIDEDIVVENTVNTQNAESHVFEAEVSQILKLMIHSLYSNKEIFLRELISNASDACDKLRFEALSNDALYEGDSELQVRVSVDKEARTLTISDNGIGMSKDEVVNNIGTIARSGTKAFLEQLSGDQQKDSHLIGQFGVGFYSSFIVADQVEVVTRRAGESTATYWASEGTGEYTLADTEREKRGTDVVLHLREDEEEFLDDWRLRSVIKRYSDNISLPVQMLTEIPSDSEEGEEDKAPEKEWQAVNSAKALWTRAKNEISDEEYKEFYKSVAHDWTDPQAWVHTKAEGKYEYTSLFYIPSQKPFDLYDRDATHGIKLYVQRVFIMDDNKDLMPNYLRFVRGLVDSNDLPLNVSRELLQSNRVIDSIRSASVKKVLGLIEGMAKNEPEKFESFWTNFGQVFKEGIVEDFANRERILKICRFASTHKDTPEQSVSVEDYIARMKPGQESIYYITADSFAAAKNSPHLEAFRAKEYEVLLLNDRVDEWVMSHVTEFEGKSFVSVAKGDLELSDDEKADKEKAAEESKDFIERIQNALKDQVEGVRPSTRLTQSPACLVMGEQDMALHMQQLLKQAGHEIPANKPTLELNLDHPLVKRLDGEGDDARFGDLVEVLYGQAVIAEGGQLDDPAGFVKKLNTLLTAA
ncbi:heat shock protein HtpG [gamma proteobacterium HTCC5015]|nr:heat shock protein HtpG [gamma proteobacterium HTCC5015]